MAQTSVRI